MVTAVPSPPEVALPETATSVWRRCREELGQGRTELVRRYAPWVRMVARSVFLRVRGRSDDWPDYVQNGMLGMLEAIKSFDIERGVPFEAYARPRVRGAVFNGLRALRTLPSELGTERLSDESVASLLEDDNDDPVERLVAMVSGLALGHGLSLHGDMVAMAEPAGPYDAAVRSQLGERLSKHLQRLGERERLVLDWHYLQHLSFAHVADVLGISRGRVSQLHRQALQRLRERMMHDQWQQSL
jgi:RNA polymerase sigma factor for flagellar operon FliA